MYLFRVVDQKLHMMLGEYWSNIGRKNMSQWNQILMPFENIFHVLDHYLHFDIQQGRKQKIPLEILTSWILP